MAKEEFDGVLEAVRVDEFNQLVLARIYEKHGAVWNDHFLVSRDELIQRMKAGQKFAFGSRVVKLGSTFDTHGPLHLANFEDHAFIRLDSERVSADLLNGIPRF